MVTQNARLDGSDWGASSVAAQGVFTLMFVPGAQGIGASLIGGGALSFAGGYVSEALGGSYGLGWSLGNVLGSALGGMAGNAYMNSTRGQIYNNARYWNKGTFASSRASLKYHYNKHGAGMTVTEYTNSARTFANNNSSLLKYTYNHKYNNASWYYSYTSGSGGYFTGKGKIITFWS